MNKKTQLVAERERKDDLPESCCCSPNSAIVFPADFFGQNDRSDVLCCARRTQINPTLACTRSKSQCSSLFNKGRDKLGRISPFFRHDLDRTGTHFEGKSQPTDRAVSSAFNDDERLNSPDSVAGDRTVVLQISLHEASGTESDPELPRRTERLMLPFPKPDEEAGEICPWLHPCMDFVPTRTAW